MVHEHVHASTMAAKVPDDGKPYPENRIERFAYTTQFVYLIKQGYKSLNDIFKIPTWEHKKKYGPVLIDYFERARASLKSSIARDIYLHK